MSADKTKELESLRKDWQRLYEMCKTEFEKEEKKNEKLRAALEEIVDSEGSAHYLERYRSMEDVYNIARRAIGREVKP